MWTTRTLTQPSLGGSRAASFAPRTDDLVVDLEFSDGPLRGRRVTGLASTADLYFVGFAESGMPLLGHTPRGGTSLGIYRFEHAYDCARTVERVYVFRWMATRSEPSDLKPAA